jgi:penicillin-insensitive murein endopeptidase
MAARLRGSARDALLAHSDTPAPGPLHIIGGQAAGCIAGAVRLPAEGIGFQTIHLARSSFWGAPSTIARIERLGEQVHAAGLGDLTSRTYRARAADRCPAGMSAISSGSMPMSA